MAGKSIGVYDQFNQITYPRGVRDDVPAWGIQRPRFVCGSCGHTNHADINAAENIASLGHDCETAWTGARRPPMVRPEPRLRRRETDIPPAPHTALAA